MNKDTQQGRAARHIALPQIGHEGQERIASSTALLIGIGGIGCATASYLASSGVAHLILCDFDTVDATNLGRQVLYGPADIGELKANRRFPSAHSRRQGDKRKPPNDPRPNNCEHHTNERPHHNLLGFGGLLRAPLG